VGKINIFSVLLCVIIILVGVFWGAYDYKNDYQISWIEIKQGLFNTSVNQSVETIIPSVRTEKSKTPVVSSVIKPVSATASDQFVESVLNEAEKYYNQLRFLEALLELKSLVDNVPVSLFDRYKDLKHKNETFLGIITDISLTETAADNLVEIKLADGNVISGTLLSEKYEYIIVQVNGKEITYRRPQILSYKKLNLQERQQQLLNEYRNKRVQLEADPAALQYVNIAIFCYRNQLNNYVLELLGKALQKDGQLLNTYREDKARGLYEDYHDLRKSGSYDKAEVIRERLLTKYPETKYAHMIKNGLQENEVGLQKNEVSPQGNESRLKAQSGDKYFEEGKKHLENTFKRGPDYEQEGKAATDDFRKALEFYEAARNIMPGSEINNKISKTNQCLLMCMQQFRRSGQK
jgi:hypothetical protein